MDICSVSLRFLLVLCCLQLSVVRGQLYQTRGEIVACQGCFKARFQALHKFLKEEAHEYSRVTITWTLKEQATLRIFHDEKYHSELDLTLFPTREALHKVMASKGFQRMSAEQLEAQRIQRMKVDLDKGKEQLQRYLEQSHRDKLNKVKDRYRLNNAIKEYDATHNWSDEHKNVVPEL